MTVEVSPSPANQAPDAVNDSASTPSSTAKEVDVLANDTDPDGHSLFVTSKTNGSNGTVSCTSLTCTYTPTGTSRGSDSFTYTISDGRGGRHTATVSMTVTNRAPDAVNDSGGAGDSQVLEGHLGADQRHRPGGRQPDGDFEDQRGQGHRLLLKHPVHLRRHGLASRGATRSPTRSVTDGAERTPPRHDRRHRPCNQHVATRSTARVTPSARRSRSTCWPTSPTLTVTR